MACNNGKKGFHSPYGMITDLNITYTGCSTTCNGEEINPGMRLREILDILIGNCSEGGSATWGDIIGNIEDQTDLVQFIQDNISVTNWGSILGDIEDQQDLVDYVAANGFGEDKVGKNLHLGGDGKLNAGVDPTPFGVDGTIITSDGIFDPGNLTPYISLIETLGIEVYTSGGNLTQTTGGGDISQTTGGGDISQTTGGGDISQTTGGGDISQEASGGRLIYRTTGVGDIYLGASNIAPPTIVPGTVTISADTSFMVETQSSGEKKLLIDNNVKINPSAEYPEGMPSSPSDNVLPTIGYVRDTLISDAITAAITPLVQQIADLEARVQDLENATP